MYALKVAASLTGSLLALGVSIFLLILGGNIETEDMKQWRERWK